jgi:hypothetical protein
MAAIQTKWVDVGGGNVYTTTEWGFDPTFSFGTMSNTADGASDVSINSVFTSTNVVDLFWYTNTSLTGIYFRISTLQSNSGFERLIIGSTEYVRGNATSYSQLSGQTIWQWTETTGTGGAYSVNPFGTTAGANVQVVFDDSASSVTYIGISSGAISLGDLQTFFGGTSPASLSEYYRGGGLVPDIPENSGIPTSGVITLADFYDSAK